MSSEFEVLVMRAAKVTGYVLGVIVYVCIVGFIINLISMVLPGIAILLGIAAFVFHLVFLLLWADNKMFPKNRNRFYS